MKKIKWYRLRRIPSSLRDPAHPQRFMAPSHKARLTALHAICIIFYDSEESGSGSSGWKLFSASSSVCFSMPNGWTSSGRGLTMAKPLSAFSSACSRQAGSTWNVTACFRLNTSLTRSVPPYSPSMVHETGSSSSAVTFRCDVRK